MNQQSSCFKKVYLGKAAREYLRVEFENGSALSRLLKPEELMSEGEVYTFLPQSADASEIKDFSRGGVFSSGPEVSAGKGLKISAVQGNTSMVSTLLADALSEERRLILFDDMMASPGDTYLNESPSTVFTYEGEVCHYIDAPIPGQLEKAISFVHLNWHFFAAVVSFDTSLSLEAALRSGEVNSDFMVIGAFDGEGFIVWDNTRCE